MKTKTDKTKIPSLVIDNTIKGLEKRVSLVRVALNETLDEGNYYSATKAAQSLAEILQSLQYMKSVKGEINSRIK